MRASGTILEVLRRRGPFCGLGEMELRTLSHLMKDARVEDGEPLFAEGDEAREAFLVIEGTVDIVQRGDDGTEHVRATLGPGDLFGELALFSTGRRSAGAIARGRTILAAIDHDAFLAAVRAHPAVAVALLRMQAERFARLDREHRQLLDT